MTKTDFFVDALPYIDKGFNDPSTRLSASNLVEEEMKRFRPTKNYLEKFPILSGPVQIKNETEILKNEFDRLSNRLPMDYISMKRYELPPPAIKTDIKAWSDSLDNARAQLEHQATRLENLDLMSTYGQNAWKSYNDVIEKLLQRYETFLVDAKKKVQDLNWQRKQEQINAGKHLNLYEEQWVSLVGKNFEIEQAILELEGELKISGEDAIQEAKKF